MTAPIPPADPVALARALMAANHAEMSRMESEVEWLNSRTSSMQYERESQEKQIKKIQMDLQSAQNKNRTLESKYDTVSKLAQNNKAALEKEAAIVVAIREALNDLPSGVAVAIAVRDDKGSQGIMAVLQRIQTLVNKEKTADG